MSIPHQQLPPKVTHAHNNFQTFIQRQEAAEQFATDLNNGVTKSDSNLLEQALKMFDSFPKDLQLQINIKRFHNALGMSATNGFLVGVEKLLKYVPVDSKVNPVGETALMKAAQFKQVDMVSFLLKKGADPNIVADGKSVLLSAVIPPKNSDGEASYINKIAVMLLIKKADPNHGNAANVTPLICAIQTKNFALVNTLVRAGANINACHETGRAPLHFAAQNYAKEIFEFLLQQKELNVDHSDKNGITVLGYAAKMIQRDPTKTEFFLNNIVLPLLDAGAKAGLGEFILHTIDLNQITAMKTFMQSKHFKNNLALKDEGFTCLHFAAQVGSVEMVELLASEDSIGLRTSDGLTALHSAAIIGKLDNLNCLIAKKADVNAVDVIGNSVLVAAFIPPNETITGDLQFISESDNAKKPHVFEMIKSLLQAKANPDLPEDEFSPLMWAIAQRQKDSIQLLIETSDVHRVAHKKTALVAAVANGDSESIERLIAQKVDLEVRDLHNNTPLINAVLRGQDNIVTQLLKAGADPNGRGIKEATPLMAAAKLTGRLEILKQLIAFKADCCLEDYYDFNSMFHAVANKQKENLMILLQSGASINHPNSLQLTPFLLAVMLNNDIPFLNFMIEVAKADPTLRMMNQYTAMTFAHEPETIDYLHSLGLRGDPLVAKIKFVRAVMVGNLERVIQHVKRIQVTECLDLTEIDLDVIPMTAAENSKLEALAATHAHDEIPLYLYANECQRDVFAVVLANKLYLDHKARDSKSIDLFVKKLMSLAQNVAFSEEGALCFTLEISQKTYSVTLSRKAEAALFKVVSQDNFKEHLFDLTEEGQALKLEAEVRDLKMAIPELLNQGFYEIETCQQKLVEFRKFFETGFLKIEITELTALEQACASYKINLAILLGFIESKDFIETTDIKVINEKYSEINRYMKTFQNDVVFSLQKIQRDIDTVLVEKSVTSQKLLRKKIKQQNVQTEQSQNKNFELGCAAALDLLDMKSVLESEVVGKLRGVHQQIKGQSTKIPPKQRAAVRPKLPEKHPLIQIYDYFNTSQYLNPPARTLASATRLVSRLKAQEGRISFDVIIKDIQMDAAGIECFVDYTASLGALAQMLETRRDLGEQWPNKVRNVIFHFEEGLKKMGNEAHCILQVKKIHQRLSVIPEAEETRTLGRISIDRIDSEGFLSGLLEASNHIPAFSLQRAEALIQQSKDELDRLRDYIAKNQSQAMENKKLKMAVGFVLSRIGTQLNDIRDKDPKHAHPLLSTIYGKNIPVGNAYRHNDPTWQGRVEAFMAESLKTSSTPLFQAKLETNRKLETKKQHGSKASASTALVQVSQTSDSTMQPSTTAAPKVSPQTPVTVVSLKTSGSAGAVLTRKKKKK